MRAKHSRRTRALWFLVLIGFAIGGRALALNRFRLGIIAVVAFLAMIALVIWGITRTAPRISPSGRDPKDFGEAGSVGGDLRP